MKVCIIVEGSYPYINGGVSSWLQQLMLELPEVEFGIQVISASRDEKRKFMYEIPANVTEIQEIYLMDDDYIKGSKKRIKLSKEEYDAFESLLFGEEIDWNVIFSFFQKKNISINALLSSEGFFQMVSQYYKVEHKRTVFSDFLWTMRSTYLPLFLILKSQIMKADIYHPISTGYAGILGAMQAKMSGKKLILSEHGIYTREREEEIIKAEWVKGVYKDLWISHFKKISLCCYEYADKVVSLFKLAQELQVELGCDKKKTIIIPNGVNAKDFENLGEKAKDDKYINIGAVARVTPIKDVKTLISAFSIAKKVNPELKLWIMGSLDESPGYVGECKHLVDEIKAEDVIFTDTVNVKDYLGRMDMLVLSSMSEGQPLAILEGFAAKKPFIATNVGNCSGLIYGENDDLGKAGYVVPVMSVAKMAKAILKLASDEGLRSSMGEIGYQRVITNYNSKDTYLGYRKVYEELFKELNKKGE